VKASLVGMCLVLAGASLSGEALASVQPRAAQPAQARERSGIGLVITGAAARIPQEAALLQALDERGLLKGLVFISGDSSGALNAVALNAIKSGRMTWKRYREILSGLKNEDVFAREGKRLPVDTAPLRKLLERVVAGEMGFERMADLPIATSISITRMKDLGLERTAYRMSNRPINAESDPALSVVDLLMASSAFPIVFPPARIRGAQTIPDIDYVDGGAGEDYVPFEALLEFERLRGQGLDRVYVISRKGDGVPEISEELRGLGVDDHRLFDKLGISMDSIASRRLARHLEAFARKSPELAARSYVWRPDFQRNFLLFDFSGLDAQYVATEEWAAHNAPVLLERYLEAMRKRY
jgi:predicted acylesterase/phospholipase RssA